MLKTIFQKRNILYLLLLFFAVLTFGLTLMDVIINFRKVDVPMVAVIAGCIIAFDYALIEIKKSM